MKTPLPQDQDRLLREYNDIYNQERLKLYSEQRVINLFLIGLSWILGGLLTIFLVFDREYTLIPVLLISESIFSIGLIGAYKGKEWGYFTSTTTILLMNLYITYFTYAFSYHSDFNTLVDGIVIFVYANQLGRFGFTFASVIMTIKMIVLFYFFPGNQYPEHILATIINANTLGAIPLLVLNIARASKNAQRQQLRAQILLEQNEELAKSWKGIYDKMKEEKK